MIKQLTLVALVASASAFSPASRCVLLGDERMSGGANAFDLWHWMGALVEGPKRGDHKSPVSHVSVKRIHGAFTGFS